MKIAVTYYYVPTAQKSKGGFGLEAEQEIVCLLADRQSYQATAYFTEIKSRKKNQRPQILAALARPTGLLTQLML